MSGAGAASRRAKAAKAREAGAPGKVSTTQRFRSTASFT